MKWCSPLCYPAPMGVPILIFHSYWRRKCRMWGSCKYLHVLTHQHMLSFSLESSFGSSLASGISYFHAVTLNADWDDLVAPVVFIRGDEGIKIKLHWVVIAGRGLGRCRDSHPCQDVLFRGFLPRSDSSPLIKAWKKASFTCISLKLMTLLGLF